MAALSIALLTGLGFLLAYNTYGRWLARSIFRLDPEATAPSVALNDDRDYVPTNRSIVFGHHFTSIAGTGPIVGPALAITWGWLPALLWVMLGCVFIGAMHDFSTLVVSLRNRGQTVGDIAGRVLNGRVRFLFLGILLLALWIVIAVFGWVIATVFRMFPESILPVFLQIPIAIWIGVKVHRRGRNLLTPSLIALGLMYATVWFGAACPGLAWTGGAIGAGLQALNSALAAWPIWLWVAILLAYCYVASVLPVWLLLQPRDYINSLQLLSSLALIVAGLGAAAIIGGVGPGGERIPLELVAPTVNLDPVNAPPIFPFLFVIVACGAVSGFHCLVSSGTSSKQLRSEMDAQFVGYGAMLTEGFLAVLVILAVGAGIGLGWKSTHGDLVGAALWGRMYADWDLITGGAAIAAFVVGAGNFLESIGIEHTMATALMGVLVASFAGTTMDTATRLQRYIAQELSRAAGASVPALRPITVVTGTRHGATFFAVASAFVLAILPPPGSPWNAATIGTGGLILWPVFGATNQLLAGLALLVVIFWLWRRRLPVWFAIGPAIFMLIVPAASLVWQVFVSDGSRPAWLLQDNPNWPLIAASLAALVLQAWLVVEALLLWPKVRGVLEEVLPQMASRPPMTKSA
jgi:carbon starvation protein